MLLCLRFYELYAFGMADAPVSVLGLGKLV